MSDNSLEVASIKQKVMDMTFEERRQVRNTVSRQTELATKELVDEFGRALIVRPTGFGKTYMLCKFTEKYYLPKYPDAKFLYIFPSYIIVNEIKAKSGVGDEYETIYPHLNFLSYQAIALAFGENGSEDKRQEIIQMVKNSPIVLLDEVHKSGAPNFVKFMNDVDDLFGVDKTHLVGVTATIFREKDEETAWIIEEEFKGHMIYPYTTSQAFCDGVFLPLHRVKPVFDIKLARESLEGRLKASKLPEKYKSYQKSRVDELIRNWKGASEVIYDAIADVGYRLDSDDPADSFMRFIVFFNGVQHLQEEGEMIENYFRDAVNKVASEKLGKEVKTEVYIEYVVSTTADKNHEYIVKQFCEGREDRCYRTEAEQVCTDEIEITELGRKHKDYVQKSPKPHRLELIFNINVITMGYHVPHIAGVMFLRDTSTYITNRQQLGRCLSITNTRQAIVYDVVDNLSKRFNDEKRGTKTSEFGSQTSGEPKQKGSGRDVELHIKYKDYVDDDVMFFEGEDLDMANLNTISNEVTILSDLCKYMYVERKCPIAFIANELDISISSVMKVLKDAKVPIAQETGEYEFVSKHIDDETYISQHRTCSESFIPFINSKEAHLAATSKESGIKTVYNMFRKLFSR